MAQYKTPTGDGLSPLVARIKSLEVQLRDLTRPTGTALVGIVAHTEAVTAAAVAAARVPAAPPAPSVTASGAWNGDGAAVSVLAVSWDLTAPESAGYSLTIDEDASELGSLSWATGGRSADTVLVSRAYDPALVDLGFPLMEITDSSHSSVSVQATLDGYAAANVAGGRRPAEVWAFNTKAYPVGSDGTSAGHSIDEYTVGDYAALHLDPYDPETGRGDPYLAEGGTVLHRIVGLSGDSAGDEIKIQLAQKVTS